MNAHTLRSGASVGNLLDLVAFGFDQNLPVQMLKISTCKLKEELLGRRRHLKACSFGVIGRCKG